MATAASRRSNARSRAIAGGLALAVAVLAAVVVVSFVWPRDDNPRRTAVANYLDEVDAIERSLAIELQRAGRVYEAFGDPKTDPDQRRADVERGERAITALEQRTRALQPPPEAASFHEKLISLFALQSSLARDASALVRYFPAQARAQGTVADALSRLRRSLVSSRDPAGQAAAFGRFEEDARRAAASLAAVPVPETLEPVRRAERERVRRLAAVAVDLRAALERGDAREIEQLLGQLAELVARGVSAAQRQAVIAYNRRVDLVAKRQDAVRAELAALDRRLS